MVSLRTRYRLGMDCRRRPAILFVGVAGQSSGAADMVRFQTADCAVLQWPERYGKCGSNGGTAELQAAPITWQLTRKKEKHMAKQAKNTICLWYDHGAEDAARFYAKTFP